VDIHALGAGRENVVHHVKKIPAFVGKRLEDRVGLDKCRPCLKVIISNTESMLPIIGPAGCTQVLLLNYLQECVMNL
jgi:hypothetical protein